MDARFEQVTPARPDMNVVALAAVVIGPAL
jgi:hypothetical protein